MSKTNKWSKCLTDQWSTLREVCLRMNWSDTQGIEYMMNKCMIPSQKSYDARLRTFSTLLLYYDVVGKTLHLFFMDKQLRDFLSTKELMDYEDLKSYIKDNGNFYPMLDSWGRINTHIHDFPFCIHIKDEKIGYSFDCQIIDKTFHLVASWKYDFMIDEKQYKTFVQTPKEKLSHELNEYIKLYRLALNTIAYINCFSEYVKDGVPDVSIPYSSNKNGKIIETSNELHEEIEEYLKNPSIRSPYLKRGHFMYLKSERYTNKRGQLVWRKPCMVKGKAKTVYTNEELIHGAE